MSNEEIRSESVIGGWRTMDTAPKGGERILLYGPDGVDIGSWEPHWFPGAWLRQSTAEYDNDGAFISQPTRWMPLPAPPYKDHPNA